MSIFYNKIQSFDCIDQQNINIVLFFSKYSTCVLLINIIIYLNLIVKFKLQFCFIKNYYVRLIDSSPLSRAHFPSEEG